MIKNFIPPIILRFFRNHTKYGFFGDYQTWPEARADSVGYDNPKILEKVKNSLLEVKNSEIAYERDSIVFEKIEYSWPVLAGLLWIASRNENKLNVLDFGGSLGSSYFQNINFLKHLRELRWNIVEQKNFVEVGHKSFEDQYLKFYSSIKECLADSKPQVILVSSTIQYLEQPYEFLIEAVQSGFEYIIFDRTAFLPDRDRLTIQKVRPGIYNASYPAWFLNEKKFLKIMAERYELVAEFDSLGGDLVRGIASGNEKGFLFKKLSQKT